MRYELIISTVKNINSDIRTQLGDEMCVHMHTDGTSDAVIFMEEIIWDNDDKERKEIDGKLEPLEPFLRAKIMNLLTDICKLKL